MLKSQLFPNNKERDLSFLFSVQLTAAALTGNPTIRWGDKSYNSIAFADGTFGSTCDVGFHTWFFFRSLNAQFPHSRQFSLCVIWAWLKMENKSMKTFISRLLLPVPFFKLLSIPPLKAELINGWMMGQRD